MHNLIYIIDYCRFRSINLGRQTPIKFIQPFQKPAIANSPNFECQNPLPIKQWRRTLRCAPIGPRDQTVASTLSVLALIPVYAVLGRSAALIPLLLLAATLTAARLIAWKPWRVVGEPMLWILHLGYAWIPAGLVILAAHLLDAEFSWSVGVHALMVGATGSLILGMMARVALGHTGRPIAENNIMVGAFLLIPVSATVRVIAGLVIEPQWLLGAPAVFWCLAFLIYAIEYTPISFMSPGRCRLVNRL